MSDIGIAIIDVYDQENLNSCYESIENKENLIIISNTNNKLPDCEKKQFSGFIPFATLRNYAINNFRIKGLKHFFIINSNQIIKDQNVFEKTIKTADVFGIWAFLGPEMLKLSIEDDQHNISLNLSENINSDFIYLHTGIITNIGFFDERCFNTKSLDVLDYILRMRSKKVFPPTGFIPTINDGLEKMKGNIKKTNYREIQDADQSVNMSYAYFLTQHSYIPTQNDPKSVSNNELMSSLEELQKNYSNKL
jgi:hypothetical protein